MPIVFLEVMGNAAYRINCIAVSGAIAIIEGEPC